MARKNTLHYDIKNWEFSFTDDKTKHDFENPKSKIILGFRWPRSRTTTSNPNTGKGRSTTTTCKPSIPLNRRWKEDEGQPPWMRHHHRTEIERKRCRRWITEPDESRIADPDGSRITLESLGSIAFERKRIALTHEMKVNRRLFWGLP